MGAVRIVFALLWALISSHAALAAEAGDDVVR